MVEELKGMVGIDETILYEGKPDKKCFVLKAFSIYFYRLRLFGGSLILDFYVWVSKACSLS